MYKLLTSIFFFNEVKVHLNASKHPCGEYEPSARSIPARSGFSIRGDSCHKIKTS